MPALLDIVLAVFAAADCHPGSGAVLKGAGTVLELVLQRSDTLHNMGEAGRAALAAAAGAVRPQAQWPPRLLHSVQQLAAISCVSTDTGVDSKPPLAAGH